MSLFLFVFALILFSRSVFSDSNFPKVSLAAWNLSIRFLIFKSISRFCDAALDCCETTFPSSESSICNSSLFFFFST